MDKWNREQCLIVMERCKTMSQSCNSYRITAIGNQIRGMIWVMTGQDHGPVENTEDICKSLNIPYRKEEEYTVWGNEVDPNW
jgi:hypothetical protein